MSEVRARVGEANKGRHRGAWGEAETSCAEVGKAVTGELMQHG